LAQAFVVRSNFQFLSPSQTMSKFEVSTESSDNAAAPIVEHTGTGTVVVSHTHRSRGLTAVMVQEREAEPGKKPARCTPEIQALGLTAFLFLFITAVQAFGAKIAHSQALLVDCISMGVDGLTCFCNMFVECLKRDGKEHIAAQLFVAFFSLSCLTFFTVDALKESVHTVDLCRNPQDRTVEEGGESVNGWIVLGFAVGGIVFDLISLWAFARSHRKSGSGRQMNMWTALLHVGADLMRSTSTFVMSMLILVGGFEGGCVDAYVSLIIGITILFGAGTGFLNWLLKLINFLG